MQLSVGDESIIVGDGPKKTKGVTDSETERLTENEVYITSEDISSGTVKYHSSSNHQETGLPLGKKSPTTERENDSSLQEVGHNESSNWSTVPVFQEESHASNDLQKSELCCSDNNRDANDELIFAYVALVNDREGDRENSAVVVKSNSNFCCRCCDSDVCYNIKDSTILKLLR